MSGEIIVIILKKSKNFYFFYIRRQLAGKNLKQWKVEKDLFDVEIPVYWYSPVVITIIKKGIVSIGVQ